MGLLDGMKDMGMKIAMGQVKDNVINPKLEGIGTVEDLSWKDQVLFARVRLTDLEDHPLEVWCSDISIAPDGSNVKIGNFRANKKFMQAALDRYLAGKPLAVPAGAARTALVTARKFLGL